MVTSSPIIFVTATDVTVPRVLTAYASGAVDFIQKPLQPEILRSKVFVLAELHRAKQRLVSRDRRTTALCKTRCRARDELLRHRVARSSKNPLNAVLLGAHQIEGAAEDHEWGRVRKAAGGIAKAVDRMSRLVGDLLDLATLDAGKPLAMNVGQHDLAELVVEISELLEPLAQSNQVTLKTDVSSPTYVILCDRDRVQQVLSNLISNAIEFTRSRGAINVAANGRDGEIVVSVRDTGVGIHEDHVPHVFDAYWKADSERKNGAGLGLSIARAIVESHGVRIWVETEAGSGSSFYFTLRAADVSAASHD